MIYIILFLFSISFAAPVKNIFNVSGMMCGYGCASKINSVITALDGVDQCDVSFENSSLVVKFDDSNLNSKTIIESLPNPYVATLVTESVMKRYDVKGITCQGCIDSINSIIDKNKAIITCSIGLDGLMEIEIDINKFDEKKLYNDMPEKFKIVELLKKNEEEK